MYLLARHREALTKVRSRGASAGPSGVLPARPSRRPHAAPRRSVPRRSVRSPTPLLHRRESLDPSAYGARSGRLFFVLFLSLLRCRCLALSLSRARQDGEAALLPPFGGLSLLAISCVGFHDERRSQCHDDLMMMLLLLWWLFLLRFLSFHDEKALTENGEELIKSKLK